MNNNYKSSNFNTKTQENIKFYGGNFKDNKYFI